MYLYLHLKLRFFFLSTYQTAERNFFYKRVSLKTTIESIKNVKTHFSWWFFSIIHLNWEITARCFQIGIETLISGAYRNFVILVSGNLRNKTESKLLISKSNIHRNQIVCLSVKSYLWHVSNSEGTFFVVLYYIFFSNHVSFKFYLRILRLLNCRCVYHFHYTFIRSMFLIALLEPDKFWTGSTTVFSFGFR